MADKKKVADKKRKLEQEEKKVEQPAPKKLKIRKILQNPSSDNNINYNNINNNNNNNNLIPIPNHLNHLNHLNHNNNHLLPVHPLFADPLLTNLLLTNSSYNRNNSLTNWNNNNNNNNNAPSNPLFNINPTTYTNSNNNSNNGYTFPAIGSSNHINDSNHITGNDHISGDNHINELEIENDENIGKHQLNSSILDFLHNGQNHQDHSELTKILAVCLQSATYYIKKAQQIQKLLLAGPTSNCNASLNLFDDEDSSSVASSALNNMFEIDKNYQHSRKIMDKIIENDPEFQNGEQPKEQDEDEDENDENEEDDEQGGNEGKK